MRFSGGNLLLATINFEPLERFLPEMGLRPGTAKPAGHSATCTRTTLSRKYLCRFLVVMKNVGGGRVVRWCWVNFQCRGVLLVWIRVGQGPIALAVDAGGGCLDIFSLVYRFSFLSPSGVAGWCDGAG